MVNGLEPWAPAAVDCASTLYKGCVELHSEIWRQSKSPWHEWHPIRTRRYLWLIPFISPCSYPDNVDSLVSS